MPLRPQQQKQHREDAKGEHKEAQEERNEEEDGEEKPQEMKPSGVKVNKNKALSDLNDAIRPLNRPLAIWKLARALVQMTENKSRRYREAVARASICRYSVRRGVFVVGATDIIDDHRSCVGPKRERTTDPSKFRVRPRGGPGRCTTRPRRGPRAHHFEEDDSEPPSSSTDARSTASKKEVGCF